ncbi:tailspike protein/preneck appendage [Bacteroides phage PhiCrAssBcn23]|nr:tailspike protein/preneck appendage [Bacteroides phage PhiCrAssBcn22]WCS67315.1 tailspike protein/preneck appendage [Bacteroides phage PhiCrAssBcn23]
MAIQDKFNKSNVIYKITRDIDLDGGTLTIPAGCTLDFQGGTFSNGTIVGNATKIIAKRKVFNTITLAGTWDTNFCISNFANSGDNVTTIVNNILDVISLGGTLIFQEGNWILGLNKTFIDTTVENYFNIIGESGSVITTQTGSDFALSISDFYKSGQNKTNPVRFVNLNINCNSSGGLQLKSGRINIEGCTITNVGKTAIELNDCGGAHLSSSKLVGNRTVTSSTRIGIKMWNNSSDGIIEGFIIDGFNKGIHIIDCGGNRYLNNTIWGSPICLENETYTFHRGNIITGNQIQAQPGGIGIYCHGTVDTTGYPLTTVISDNFCYIDTSQFIKIDSGTQYVISDNVCTSLTPSNSDKLNVIELNKCYSSNIINNIISDLYNNWSGIFISNCGTINIDKNIVASLSAGGILVELGDNNSYCTISNNSNQQGAVGSYLVSSTTINTGGSFINNRPAGSATLNYAKNYDNFVSEKGYLISNKKEVEGMTWERPLALSQDNNTHSYLWFNGSKLYIKSGSKPTTFTDGALLVINGKPNNGATSDRPAGLTSTDTGFQFYDRTLIKPIWWNGTAWIDATGATV